MERRGLLRNFQTIPPANNPRSPPNVPDYPDDADENERQDLQAALDIQRRDDAVVRGFLKGFGEKNRDTCEEKLYQDLKHVRFGYDEVWSEEYMVKIKRHSPLDVRAIKEAKQHLFSRWARLDNDRLETIKGFGVRLKMEQDSLRRDGVTVSNQGIKEHYLLEVYRFQAFTNEITRTFQQLEPDDQDWGQMTNYFENTMEDMEELERLIGETPRAWTLEDIKAALEQNMGKIFGKFDAQAEQRVKDVVNVTLEKALESANTATDPKIAK